jgi:hypothetical protein
MACEDVTEFRQDLGALGDRCLLPSLLRGVRLIECAIDFSRVGKLALDVNTAVDG